MENHLIEQKPETSDQNRSFEAASTDPNWVPWTAQQTFRGVLFTLIPWIAFLLIQTSGSGNPGSNPTVTQGQDLAGAFIAFILTALVEGIFLLAPYHYARKTLAQFQKGGRAIFRALGLRRFQIGRTLPIIFGLLVLIIGINVVYSFVINILHLNIQTNDQVLLRESATQPLTVYGLLAGSVLIAPFCEEIFFRGFVLAGLLRELSPAWAIVISASLFAIAHTDPSSFVPLLVIGLCLGFLRWHSGSTWASILLHMLNNLLASVLIVLSMHGINLPF
jgi:uncharacterized protein